MLRLALSLLTCMLVTRLCLACMPPQGWVRQDWSMVPMFTAAPYVLYVEGVAADETNNMVTFKVHCVLKTPPAEDVAEEIYVPDVVFKHSCSSNPFYKNGTFYITGLQKSTYAPQDYQDRIDRVYNNYGPVISTRNMYESDDANVNKAFNICGMSAIPKAGTCPKYDRVSPCSSPAPKTTTTLPIANNSPVHVMSVTLLLVSAVASALW